MCLHQMKYVYLSRASVISLAVSHGIDVNYMCGHSIFEWAVLCNCQLTIDFLEKGNHITCAPDFADSYKEYRRRFLLRERSLICYH